MASLKGLQIGTLGAEEKGKAVAKFIVPYWGDKVDYGIDSVVVPARQPL